jgi:CrcB protein
MRIVAVFIGGGIGAILRYWLGGSVYRFMGADFPYGTLLVNVLGCFFIGFLAYNFEERFVIQPWLRSFLAIGLLGGFTTFSTFSIETIALLQDGSYLRGIANVVYSLFIGLGATWFGITIGRLL